jgi:hypothetical protein
MVQREVIIEILLEASNLLQKKGWNKYSMALDQNGDKCGPDSSEAACYCLSGALVKAWRSIDPESEDFYFKYFEKRFSDVLRARYNYDRTFTQWNDNVAMSREDVVNLIHLVVTSLLVEQPSFVPEVELLSA